MYQKHKVLCVIPARGGSKGLLNKNLKKIGGKTLVEWAINVARACTFIDKIIVTSDSSKIIKVANKLGDYAPFKRPANLVKDNTPSLPVFVHALNWAEKSDNTKYKYVIALEPNSPFRLPRHIKKGVKIAYDKMASSVVSLVKVSDHHPIRIKKLMSDGKVKPFCIEEPEGLRRQDQEPAFIRNSAIYIFNSSTLKSNRLYGNKPYGFEVDRKYFSINIDDEADLYHASFLYNKLKKDGDLNKILPVNN